MDSRNLEEQRLGGMGQCAKAVLKVLRKVVKKSDKKVSSEFSLFFKIFGTSWFAYSLHSSVFNYK